MPSTLLPRNSILLSKSSEHQEHSIWHGRVLCSFHWQCDPQLQWHWSVVAASWWCLPRANLSTLTFVPVWLPRGAAKWFRPLAPLAPLAARLPCACPACLTCSACGGNKWIFLLAPLALLANWRKIAGSSRLPRLPRLPGLPRLPCLPYLPWRGYGIWTHGNLPISLAPPARPSCPACPT